MQDDAKVLTLLGLGESPCTDERGVLGRKYATRGIPCQDEKVGLVNLKREVQSLHRYWGISGLVQQWEQNSFCFFTRARWR